MQMLERFAKASENGCLTTQKVRLFNENHRVSHEFHEDVRCEIGPQHFVRLDGLNVFSDTEHAWNKGKLGMENNYINYPSSIQSLMKNSFQSFNFDILRLFSGLEETNFKGDMTSSHIIPYHPLSAGRSPWEVQRFAFPSGCDRQPDVLLRTRRLLIGAFMGKCWEWYFDRVSMAYWNRIWMDMIYKSAMELADGVPSVIGLPKKVRKLSSYRTDGICPERFTIHFWGTTIDGKPLLDLTGAFHAGNGWEYWGLLG